MDSALAIGHDAPRSGLLSSPTLRLGFFMLIAIGLSVFFFSGASLRLDESQSLWQSGRSPVDILTVVSQDVHVPLYHEVLHYWRLIVGDSVFAARALSMLFYLLLIPATYLLGARAYGRSAGIFAAGMLAISPFMNWYGNEIRMYTLFALLVVLNQYFFLRLWRGGSERRDHDWAAYGLTALLGIFTHYFFSMVLLSQLLFYFLRRDLFVRGSFGRFLIVWGLLAACFAPWAAFVLIRGQAQNASPTLAAPTTINLFSVLAEFVFGFQDDHLNTVILSLWPLTILLAFLALRKSSRMQPETQYFLLTVAISVAVAFGVSLWLAPLFVSRYLIFTVPSLYLLLGSLFSLYPPRAARAARGVLVCVMLMMLAVEIANPSTPVKENYEQASAYLTEHAQAQDVVVISSPFTIYPIEYYYRGVAPLSTIPLWDRYAYGPIPPFDESKLLQEAQSLQDHQYAWVLLSYDQGYEKNIKDYFDSHYERVYEENFSKDLSLYVYKMRYDTPLSKESFSLAQ